MLDQRVYDAVDWAVQELHDREIPRRLQMRVHGVAVVASNILSNPSGYLVNAWILLCVMFIIFLDERFTKVHGEKGHSTINVLARTTSFSMMLRAALLGFCLSSLIVHPTVVNLLDEVLYLLFIYHMTSVVPHEPPAKRRLRVRAERATVGL